MEITSRRFLDTPTNSVHAVTIEFWEGHPVFSWFGGSREGAQDVSIYLHNLNDDGKNIIIGSRDTVPRWNPILFSHKDRLWLFYKAGTFCDRWQTFINDITDWDNDILEREIQETAQVLSAGLNGPVKTRPVEIGESVLCGSAVETFHDWTSYMEEYKVTDQWEFIERSKPLGVREKEIYQDPFNGRIRISMGIIQPSIWQDEDGMHAFFRSSGGLSGIYYSKCLSSTSSGTDEWTEPVATNLPNPNSGVDTVYHNDKLYLVSNPDPIMRQPLVIQEIEKVSDSEWKVVDEIVIREDIEEEDKFGPGHCISTELSYPYMVENEGSLHLVYTYGRSRAEYLTISI